MPHDLPKPTLAALPGAAAGARFSLAVACDLRIAAESVFMVTALKRLGLPGDYGGSWFLTRLGLFDRVVPDSDLQVEAMKLARELAAGPPVAYRMMKENLNRALQADRRTCLGEEADRQCQAAETEDFKEAAWAFREGRRSRGVRGGAGRSSTQAEIVARRAPARGGRLLHARFVERAVQPAAKRFTESAIGAFRDRSWLNLARWRAEGSRHEPG